MKDLCRWISRNEEAGKADPPAAGGEATVSLHNMKAGESATVVEIHGGGGLVRRLASMGILPGVRVRVVKNSGSIILAIKDNRLVIGRGMVKKVLVKPEE